MSRQKLKCICCAKDVQYLWPDDESITAVDGAITGMLYGAFGSSHDQSRFRVTVCDVCMTKKVNRGIVLLEDTYHPLTGRKVEPDVES